MLYFTVSKAINRPVGIVRVMLNKDIPKRALDVAVTSGCLADGAYVHKDARVYKLPVYMRNHPVQ